MPTAADDEYLPAARRLPRPTLGQTVRFARYVADAHSWYKHLPVRTRVPFAFFLDPGAGMSRVHTPAGEVALVPRADDDRQRFHYTWQATAAYRARFGHWNYHAPYNSTLWYGAGGGWESTRPEGPAVPTEAGTWAGVPGNVAGAGTAHVSAFVHPSPNLGLWAGDPRRYGLEEAGAPAEPGGGAGALPAYLEPTVGQLLDVLGRDPPPADLRVSEVHRSVPCRARVLIRRAARGHGRFRRAAALGPAWDWPDDRWVDRLRGYGLEAGRIAVAAEYVGRERERAAETGRAARSPVDGAGKMDRLTRAMADERGRQLADMTAAMVRVLDAVFPAATEAVGTGEARGNS